LYVLLALALFFFFYPLGAAPLFDLDEGAFSQATREMFLRGDFLATSLHGQPRYDKPILSYWLQAASVVLFGINEFAFRLPSALASTAWALLIFGFVRRVADTRRA
ncbi:glycosyltransferase family 39 protein, partial [Arthrospira platensis SPKY1]|nr:glycosyltransferase family 39 protein [Arthrospira platensis SPKY1]